jgi:hypothetical protein
VVQIHSPRPFFCQKPSTLLRCSRVLGAGFGPHLAQNSHKQQPTVVPIGACASQPELSQGFETGMWKLTGLIHPVYINAIVEFADRRAPIHWGTPLSTITSILRDTPRPITDLNHELPRDLAVIVRRSLAKVRTSARRARRTLEPTRVGPTFHCSTTLGVSHVVSSLACESPYRRKRADQSQPASATEPCEEHQSQPTTTSCVPHQLCILG